MIRVFPRKTAWTPTDELSFVGDPPLFRPPIQPVSISVVFTWDIPEAERLFRAWSDYYPEVDMGGPAFDDPGAEFVPGRFVKTGVTVTSRGCTKDCQWCLVPKREGWIRELPIQSGWNVIDNNLLACSRQHVELVFDMLCSQAEPVRLSGGLDAEIFHPWHVDLLKSIRLKFAWFACDYPGALPNLERIADLMSDFTREKKRCYVLLGFNGESLSQAEKRLEAVYTLGFLPFAMLYRRPSAPKEWDAEWKKLQKKWCRPAAFRTYMKRKHNKTLNRTGTNGAGFFDTQRPGG